MILKKRNFLLELMTVAIPIILEQFFTTLMGMVNIIMTSNLGEEVVSAISMIDSLSNIIISLFAAIATGGTILVSQNYGKKDFESTNKCAMASIILSIFISCILLILLIFFKYPLISSIFSDAEITVIKYGISYFSIIIFSYPILAINQTIFGILRGIGDTKTPMFITIVMNIINVILGYILIFENNFNIFGLINIHTPGFGVAGASYALCLARLIGLIISIIYLIKKSSIINLKKKYFKIDINIQKSLLNLGIPAGIESSLFQVGKLITQVFVVNMGTTIIFANSVSNSITNFIIIPGNSFSTAVMILVGQRIGRKNIDEIPTFITFAVKCIMLFFAVICLILFPFSDSIIKIYNASNESSYYIKEILYSSYIAMPLLWPISFIIPAGLRATGDIKYTMIVSIITMWSFRIISGYILGIVLGFGLLGVWMGMYLDWFIRGILFYTRLKKLKWHKHLKLSN